MLNLFRTTITKLVHVSFIALNSPAKPRTTTKFDPNNGNRTVSGTSGIIPRRSTTLYEKTSSTEKTNVIPAETKYVRYIKKIFYYCWLCASNISYLFYFQFTLMY